MRKGIVFLFLIVALNCQSQSQMNLSIYQDFRLMFIGDERGNGMFTPNILAKLEVATFQINTNNIYLSFGLEYADLESAPLHRFSLGVGYISSIPYLNKLQIGVFFNHGIIFRFKEKFMGFSGNFETSYPVAKKLRLSILYQLIDRNDLMIKYNTEKKIKGSVFLGLKMAL